MYLCFDPNIQIRPPFLAAKGRVCRFDPPPHPRLGGGFSRVAETKLIFNEKKIPAFSAEIFFILSGRLDSNQRPPTPEAGALTGLRYTPNK